MNSIALCQVNKQELTLGASNVPVEAERYLTDDARTCLHACRFLIDVFGRDVLASGSGVLDVAGGKGELAFELVNLNAIPATVVEPRPLQLARPLRLLAKVRDRSRHEWHALAASTWRSLFAPWQRQRLCGAIVVAASPAAVSASGGCWLPR